MEDKIYYFFREHMDALPIYERLEAELRKRVPEMRIKVSKTQIGFSNRRVFGAVSFLPVRKAKERPPVWLTVTFGLACRLESERIDGAVEPYPNRWTHHVMVSCPEEIDEELLGWMKEAADFSAAKR